MRSERLAKLYLSALIFENSTPSKQQSSVQLQFFVSWNFTKTISTINFDMNLIWSSQEMMRDSKVESAAVKWVWSKYGDYDLVWSKCYVLDFYPQSVISRNEFELEFSGSSEPVLWKFRAEPSWSTLIFELKPRWQFLQYVCQ